MAYFIALYAYILDILKQDSSILNCYILFADIESIESALIPQPLFTSQVKEEAKTKRITARSNKIQIFSILTQT